ncbi:MAG TPA: DUF1223 domain-containing protein [Stellaceae bacterium]|jgi:hypothetical protein|nr:DUF1223 domain-containing protein [Stellaceae bacterium]
MTRKHGRPGRLSLAAVVAIAVVACLAAPHTARAGSPVVVELFTSQGCSSCPPADEYLGELTARGDIIPLAYHVDYWNYIGWSDPFASKQMTHRQKAYSRALGQRYVYTPEMVVNGTTQEVGSNRHGVESLIEGARKAPQTGPAISLTREEDGRIRLRIGAGVHEMATIWLVKFDREHTTAVAVGENEGRTLTDYNAVRTLHQLGSWTGDAVDMVYDVNESDEPGNGGCAILVQRDGTGPIIAAAMLKFAPGS